MGRTAILSAALFCAVASLAACRARPEPPVVVKGPAFIYHTVRYPGETLTTISKWYTGRESKWKLIHTYNPAADPKSLQLGQRLQIPTQYVVRAAPMPEKFAKRYARKQKHKVTPSEKPSAAAPALVHTEAPQASIEQPISPGDSFPPEEAELPEADKDKLRDQLIENLLH